MFVTSRRHFSIASPARGQQGFTLIEVMIAVLVMAVGLLGFAMLQTLSVRFTKSAQQRTIASNLAYELVDLMRTQRQQASYYNGITEASFGTVTPGNCSRGTDASAQNNIARWKCEVKTALPDGKALVQLAADGNVTITVSWGDAFWEKDVNKQSTRFEVKSRI